MIEDSIQHHDAVRAVQPKKYAAGYGLVDSWDVEDCEDDHSLWQRTTLSLPELKDSNGVLDFDSASFTVCIAASTFFLCTSIFA